MEMEKSEACEGHNGIRMRTWNEAIRSNLENEEDFKPIHEKKI